MNPNILVTSCSRTRTAPEKGQTIIIIRVPEDFLSVRCGIKLGTNRQLTK